MKAKFIHKSRGFIGSITTRSMMGQRTVLQWEAWRTVQAFDSEAQARKSISENLLRQRGAYQHAIFLRGEKIFIA